MELCLVLGLFFIIDASLSSPADYRWNLTPDGEGKMHLVDLQPLEGVPEPAFDPASDTHFLLFTRSNPIVPQRIFPTHESIQGSNFNRDHPVRVLIHGFNSGPSSGANIAPTASYFDVGDFNVIVVDWSRGSGTIRYISARNRVGPIGRVLADLLTFLVSSQYSSWQRVECAGHSLGAHIAGMAGKATGGRINAIFGLDPAGPLFSLNAPNERLDANDAMYTEGIRTNTGGLGFTEPLVHADFYPNGGASQPGCGIDVAGSCAHRRSHEFFAESIRSRRFIARRCNSFQDVSRRTCNGEGSAVMGGSTGNVGTRGIFFLETNNNSPFARG